MPLPTFGAPLAPTMKDQLESVFDAHLERVREIQERGFLLASGYTVPPSLEVVALGSRLCWMEEREEGGKLTRRLCRWGKRPGPSWRGYWQGLFQLPPFPEIALLDRVLLGVQAYGRGAGKAHDSMTAFAVSCAPFPPWEVGAVLSRALEPVGRGKYERFITCTKTSTPPLLPLPPAALSVLQDWNNAWNLLPYPGEE